MTFVFTARRLASLQISPGKSTDRKHPRGHRINAGSRRPVRSSAKIFSFLFIGERLFNCLSIRDLSENELVGPIPPIIGNLSYTGKL